MDLSKITVDELRAKHADLELRAERTRDRWRATSATSGYALTLGKTVKQLQKRADDYARLLELTERTEGSE